MSKKVLNLAGCLVFFSSHFQGFQGRIYPILGYFQGFLSPFWVVFKVHIGGYCVPKARSERSEPEPTKVAPQAKFLKYGKLARKIFWIGRKAVFKVFKVHIRKKGSFQGFQGHIVSFQGFQGFQGPLDTLVIIDPKHGKFEIIVGYTEKNNPFLKKPGNM